MTQHFFPNLASKNISAGWIWPFTLVHGSPDWLDETAVDDLLDTASIGMFLHRGRVSAVSTDEMPGSGIIAALYRY